MDKRFTESYIEELAHKYKTGTLTPEEQADFDVWYRSHDDSEFTHTDAHDPQQIKDRMLANILTETHPIQKRKIITLWPRIAAAASILLVLSVGGYFLLHKNKPLQIAQNHSIDIKPGSNKAILTLSNGAKIVLTDAKNGKLAQQANTIVKKTDDGKVQYVADQAKHNDQAAGIQYNTMTTPRGGRYEAILADGTHVILDAGSSIRYPVQFAGKERIVEITGQVYFEVIHNAEHPFKVIVRGQMIEDVGTRFNINAYEDEPVIRTTLVDGSVRVTKNGETALLKPNQQAITAVGSSSITVKNADIENVIAWKNGQTSFNNEDIQEIMRKVSRWYDVDVRYDGQIPNRKFDGSISRNANLSDLLKVLEFDNIHFKVSGKTITVKP